MEIKEIEEEHIRCKNMYRKIRVEHSLVTEKMRTDHPSQAGFS